MIERPTGNRQSVDGVIEISAPQEAGTKILHLTGITKHYGPTRALHNVDLVVKPGEIIGVVGHNGAGKSTLMRVVVGLTVPDSGHIEIDGRDVTANHSLALARTAGIRIAFQELSLCADLKVFENVLVAHGSLGGMGWRRRASDLIGQQLDAVFPGHGISTGSRVNSLPLAQRQMVEIAQATVVVGAPLRLLILDEPTAALGKEAAQNLFRYLREQRDRGLSCLLISHRLPDILQHTDRTVVMRDGGVVAERRSSELTRRELVSLMGGESVPSAEEKEEARVASEQSIGADYVVEVCNLSGHGLSDVSMQIHRGEIVGLAGLIGHGQHELLMALWRLGSGRTQTNTRSVTIRSPLAYVTGDRQVEGIFGLWSVAKNISIAALPMLRRMGLLRGQSETHLAKEWISKLEIKGQHEFLITSLSGGSQQKVLVARALASNARVVLLDDPYRGVDVGTKMQLYKMMREEANSGRTFIWFTSENEELRECDRAYVFRNGSIVQMLQGDEIREERIIAASFEHQDEPAPTLSEGGRP